MMEKINLENYEAYFLDFAEGNLAENQLFELESFLIMHPHLRKELEEFESISLNDEPAITSNLKSELKREELTGLLLSDYLMISEVEGTISIGEKAQLTNLIKQSPEKMVELASYHKTRLIQEKTIVFKEKSALLQKEKKLIVWWHYASSVAAAALIVFLWNFSFVEVAYSPKGFAWQKAPSNYEEPIQFQFVVQEKAAKTVGEKKLLPTKPEDKTFANNIVPASRLLSKEVSNDKELISLDPIEDKQVAEAETTSQQEKEKFKEETPTLVDEDLLVSKDVSKSNEAKFIPIQEFAKNKIKDDVLKGKTFSETILEEIAEVSNEKITFERKKDRTGNTQKFALNIGKFSISRNK